MSKDTDIHTCPPHQLGWLRRPELGSEFFGYEVWELPDGELYHHDRREGPLRLPVLPRNAKCS